MSEKISETKRLKLVQLLEHLVPEERVIPSVVEGVRLFRVDRSSPRAQKAYEPGIIILAQGQKRVFLGDEIYTYNALNYLVLSVPLPIECETTASSEEPILGIYITVDPSSVGEILLEMNDDLRYNEESLPKGIYTSHLTDVLTDTTIRLLEALSSPMDGRILGPMIVKEIVYRVLCSEPGGALHAMAYHNRRFFKIARVLNRIHESFNDLLDVKSLATDAGMSVSTFHSSFKAVTNVSPIQYIKNVRLHKARILMTQDGLNVYNAALRVGYESPSQFSREYKRFFGVTPGKDTGPEANDGKYLNFESQSILSV
ncbi:AraC family transcriptional regulator [Leptospira kobayashii]|uniref:AraC family transcriptional regulator n=2 Tax=Leptospira kobayashii TaxID=1917830 RepID=A0ABN6KCF9_9LEPT|nr:AraC family transcriptional regulator [Leptospira kobayashii]